jgi:hypothetical protein
MFAGFPSSAPAAPSCNAERVVEAGGALVSLLLPESAIPFQWTFRKTPTIGVYSATREKPYQFTLATFTVPLQQTFVLAEYRVRPYRFDGVLAGEAVPLEERRLPLSVGYDLQIGTIGGRRANLNTQIIPADPSFNNPAYVSNPTGGTIFPPLPVSPNPLGTITVDTIYGLTGLNAGAAGNAPGIEGVPTTPGQFVPSLFGAAIMPQSQDGQQGPSRLPFSYYINENAPVILAVGFFSPVKIPLAFFEGTLSGYMMPKSSFQALIDEVRPCQ